MKNFIFSMLLLILSIVSGLCGYTYLSGKYELFAVFISGVLFGIFLMLLRLNVKNNKIYFYKRELEKEAINADNSTSKVKILESKIEVLEKALEKALKK